ncbi:MAG: SDR family oxidoreductase [Candidatus Fonsibacter ubiquis]|nr:SDR family oxidoreductase [Candidatus Fonsibacter ubiquis]
MISKCPKNTPSQPYTNIGTVKTQTLKAVDHKALKTIKICSLTVLGKDRECHLIARNEDELNKLSEETGQKYSICSDVTNSQSVEESLKEIENDKISGLAYCVGSIVLKSFQTTKEEDFINTFNLNVSGAIHFIRKLQKQLAENNGSIVLFSTVAVDRGFNMHSVISTPSITQSKMAKPILDNARIAEQIPLKHAMKRVGKPEDLAETAKFLLSSNSSWITGQIIHVDGGKINLET